MGIYAQHIHKKFKEFTALDNVSLEVKSRELVALLGPSGSGKTTLLRIIAGLEFADSGSVIIDGEQANEKEIQERNVGFVFQHYALFRHMTVFDNVAFGMRVRPKKRRPTDAQIKRKVQALLELVHLDAFQDRFPNQLSGGQRQRVALVRALAVEPKVLLLDEPFGALDAKVRKELRRWMRRLHEEVHITSIFVTHDQEEAMEVSDRVVVMNHGKIEQVGTPAEVWQQPANAFVYDFLGNSNQFDGWKGADGTIHLAQVEVVDTPVVAAVANIPGSRYPKIRDLAKKLFSGQTTDVPISVSTHQCAVPLIPPGEKRVKMSARPHEMWLTKTPDGENSMETHVVHINPAGSLFKLELERYGGQILLVEIPKSVFDQFSINKGDKIYVRPKKLKIFE